MLSSSFSCGDFAILRHRKRAEVSRFFNQNQNLGNKNVTYRQPACVMCEIKRMPAYRCEGVLILFSGRCAGVEL